MIAHPDDYCRVCEGYTGYVGPLNENGWCERCTYREALETIGIHLEVARKVTQTALAWRSR